MAVLLRGAQVAVLALVALSWFNVDAYNITRPPCPCQNAGICLPTGQGDGSTFCRCNLNSRLGPTFRGASCEARSQECGNHHFCLHSGICVSGGCNCSAGFSGDKCQVDDIGAHATVVSSAVSQRAPCPCQNGGQCLLIPSTGRHVCKCVAPWVGASCKVDSNTGVIDAPPPPPPPYLGPPCPCGNGGQCVLTSQGKPVCKCRAPWIGASCRVDSETLTGAPNTDAGRTLYRSKAALPGWALAVIVLGSLALIGLGILVYILICRERAGHPFFFNRPSGFKWPHSEKRESGSPVGGPGGGSSSSADHKRRFSCGGDIEKAAPFSSRGIPILVNSVPSRQPLSSNAFSIPEFRDRRNTSEAYDQESENSTVHEKGTSLASTDSERLRLERMMTEIATIVSERDDCEYRQSDTGSATEEGLRPDISNRYHEMNTSKHFTQR